MLQTNLQKRNQIRPKKPMRRPLLSLILGLASLVFLPKVLPGETPDTFNGFAVTSHAIPLTDIVSGGPPKDGIPAILHPQFVPADTVDFLSQEDRVLGVKGQTETKAYPINILNWHEIVNDRLDDMPIMITYCPLCGSGMGFRRTVGEHIYTFGVSGLLYQSDILMYDHQTESLWSQISRTAITGTSMGKTLEPIFLEHTTWKAWHHDHPKSLVLSPDTGYSRDYRHDPYQAYAKSDRLMFPTPAQQAQFHPKEWVLGIEVHGTYKAYPFSRMPAHPTAIRDVMKGEDLIVCWYPRRNTAKVVDGKGIPLPSLMAYWFAWYGFHPDTEIFTEQATQNQDTKDLDHC